MKGRGAWGPPLTFEGESVSGKRMLQRLAEVPVASLGTPEQFGVLFVRYKNHLDSLVGKPVQGLAQRLKVKRLPDLGGPRRCTGAPDAVTHNHPFPVGAVRKPRLSDCLPARAGEEGKSRMRELRSRKAVRPVVGLPDGGSAPSSLPVPAAAVGLLDDIGTGDTAGAAALQWAARQTYWRTTRHVWIGPERDPWAMLHGQVEADFAWKCERPVNQVWLQRPYERMRYDDITGTHTWWDPGGEWQVSMPCRRCWPCQLQRRREWIARAINEARVAKRTWFFTGTFREKPENPDVVVAEYQRWMKRLRKANPETKIRYLAVLERGEREGRLHVHCLLHADLKYRDITSAWVAGFFQAKLVKAEFDEAGRMDEDSARQLMYVAGYVTGDVKHKVRASLRYGKTPPPQPQRKGVRMPSTPSEGQLPLTGEAKRDYPTWEWGLSPQSPGLGASSLAVGAGDKPAGGLA